MGGIVAGRVWADRLASATVQKVPDGTGRMDLARGTRTMMTRGAFLTLLVLGGVVNPACGKRSERSEAFDPVHLRTIGILDSAMRGGDNLRMFSVYLGFVDDLGLSGPYDLTADGYKAHASLVIDGDQKRGFQGPVYVCDWDNTSDYSLEMDGSDLSAHAPDDVRCVAVILRDEIVQVGWYYPREGQGGHSWPASARQLRGCLVSLEQPTEEERGLAGKPWSRPLLDFRFFTVSSSPPTYQYGDNGVSVGERFRSFLERCVTMNDSESRAPPGGVNRCPR